MASRARLGGECSVHGRCRDYGRSDGRSFGVRAFASGPSQDLVIDLFDRLSDSRPQILVPNAVALTNCGLAPQLRIVQEHSKHAFKIGRVAATERKAGAVDDLPVLVDIAGKHAHSGGHGIEKRQVVALVADGLTNRQVAGELGLSEHTIKKYLLRIFDKVGISSRVELVLYAMAHGSNRAAEWMPGSA